MELARLITVLLALAAAGAGAAGEFRECAAAIDRGEYAEAVKQAQAIVSRLPGSAPAHVLLARAYLGMNNGPAALMQLREALRQDASSVEALYYVSKLTGILSLQQFVAVSRLAPDSARMNQIEAEALEAHGDTAGAERAYLTALEKRPGTAYIMNALGDLKRTQRQYAEALGWYEKVLQTDPGNYDALYGSGVCRRYSEAPGAALPLFRRALQADPSSMAAKMAIGVVLLLTGKAGEAIPLLEAAAHADPQLGRLQFLLGRAYQASGRAAEAQRAFERYRLLAKQTASEELLGLEEK